MIGAAGFNAYAVNNTANNQAQPQTLWLQQERADFANGPVGLNRVEETEKLSEAEIRQKKQSGEMECQTCAGRRYVDGSDDPGVSFKTPTRISASQSAQMVMSHELEHVANEGAKAEREGRKVVSSTVTTSTAMCPECGVSYTSGGVTRTVTRGESDDEVKNDFDKRAGIGRNLNVKG